MATVKYKIVTTLFKSQICNHENGYNILKSGMSTVQCGVQ